MYYISKIWNRIAYLIMWIGSKMIWDYTKHNKDLLKRDEVFTRYSKDIMTSF